MLALQLSLNLLVSQIFVCISDALSYYKGATIKAC
jgi:hypothetical protein